MIRNFLILLTLILLTNCSAPGTALLGPAFTGATTKSLAQASLSFGTNQIIKNVHSSYKKSKNEVGKIVKKIDDFGFNLKHREFKLFHK